MYGMIRRRDMAYFQQEKSSEADQAHSLIDDQRAQVRRLVTMFKSKGQSKSNFLHVPTLCWGHPACAYSGTFEKSQYMGCNPCIRRCENSKSKSFKSDGLLSLQKLFHITFGHTSHSRRKRQNPTHCLQRLSIARNSAKYYKFMSLFFARLSQIFRYSLTYSIYIYICVYIHIYP